MAKRRSPKARQAGRKAQRGQQDTTAAAARRAYVRQTEVPRYSLDQALRIPRAIGEHYAYRPTAPLNVAAALELQPNSAPFRMLCGAASAYGLTKGAWNSAGISIEPLGLRIVRPTTEGDDIPPRRQAFLTPRVIGEFLRRYVGAPLPRKDIALNVLDEIGVPPDRREEVYNVIVEGAETLGLLRQIKGKQYVDLEGVPEPPPSSDAREEETEEPSQDSEVLPSVVSPAPSAARTAIAREEQRGAERRVFITHGKNRAFIDTIKKLLGFGELQAIVSVERPSVSQPVPDKVLNEMRSCGAAIIHVDAEDVLYDKDGNERPVINPNVLIEIGASLALYGRRFILLVKEDTKLPSNLQGLFEVRYVGDQLDGEATLKLLEATNDIKNHPIPDRYSKPSP